MLDKKRPDETWANFSDRLGISEPYLSLLRGGHRPLSDSLARKAVRLWPDLARLFLSRAMAGIDG